MSTQFCCHEVLIILDPLSTFSRKAVEHKSYGRGPSKMFHVILHILEQRLKKCGCGYFHFRTHISVNFQLEFYEMTILTGKRF